MSYITDSLQLYKDKISHLVKFSFRPEASEKVLIKLIAIGI
uniref:Uncharacterized protein n=1 Tax=Anguilla anguilla TaxID=7936 RepID=A0A0E9QH59_ANGAN